MPDFILDLLHLAIVVVKLIDCPATGLLRILLTPPPFFVIIEQAKFIIRDETGTFLIEVIKYFIYILLRHLYHEHF